MANLTASLKDYLLMRTAIASPNEITTHKSNSGTASDENLSNRRLLISILGILLGIFLSFIITGLEKIPGNAETTNTVQTSDQDKGSIGVHWPNKDQLLVMGLITLVICLLSYQGLYAGLKMYKNEPAILILCFSFQYGFFWQSVVKGATTILS